MLQITSEIQTNLQLMQDQELIANFYFLMSVYMHFPKEI